MSYTSRALIVAALLIALGVYGAVRKPYGTLLPLDVSDLSGIQPQLDRLDSEERELVLGYLKRSNGDVLPAAMADPDTPFTARTFGEAGVDDNLAETKPVELCDRRVLDARLVPKF